MGTEMHKNVEAFWRLKSCYQRNFWSKIYCVRHVMQWKSFCGSSLTSDVARKIWERLTNSVWLAESIISELTRVFWQTKRFMLLFLVKKQHACRCHGKSSVKRDVAWKFITNVTISCALGSHHPFISEFAIFLCEGALSRVHKTFWLNAN